MKVWWECSQRSGMSTVPCSIRLDQIAAFADADNRKNEVTVILLGGETITQLMISYEEFRAIIARFQQEKGGGK